MSEERLDAKTYIPFPFPFAVHSSNVREEKERDELDIAFQSEM